MKKVFSKSKPSCKVTFSLPKEAVKDATEVTVVGDFNDWNQDSPLKLKKSKDGSFASVLELPIGKDYEFRYLIDKVRWENDWTADNYVASAFVDNVQNSVVSLPSKKTSVKKEVTTEPIAEVVEPTTKKKAIAKKAKKSKTESQPTKVAKTVRKTTSTKKAKKSVKEDLKKIEGIGPKIAAILAENGISTFKELSKASKKKLTTILEGAGSRYKMHDPSTWAEQAKLAAKGAWEDLDSLQEALKGGKRK